MSYRLLFVCFSLMFHALYGQSAFVIHGLTAYYFIDGNKDDIDSSKIYSLFLANKEILSYTSKTNKKDSSYLLNLYPRLFENNLKFKYKKVHVTLQNSTCQSAQLFFKKQGNYSGEIVKNILYFEKNKKGSYRFLKSSDSLIINGVSRFCRGHLTVFLSTDFNGVQVAKVVNFYGKNIEIDKSLALKKCVNNSVFINGYRGPLKENEPTDNMISLSDRHYYWFRFDDRFAKRMQITNQVYADGSLSIKTSTHKNRLQFTKSLLLVKLGLWKTQKERVFNIEPNPVGFEIRKQNGRIAGLNYRSYLETRDGLIDTSNFQFFVVCHSMGYAYALGMIASLENWITVKKLYVLAPENASQESIEFARFKEVWQYGANLDQENFDNFKFQDGVAPQVGIKNLPESANSGRLFPPADWPNKEFIHSHMIYSFDWIFDRIYPGEKGYIFPE